VKVQDLTPPERRLLRRAGQVDPNPTKLEPRDEAHAERLCGLGLVDEIPMFGGRYMGARITEAGRRAL
jgi:hypothetical protein